MTDQKTKPLPADRTTITERIYYQVVGEEPKDVEHSFSIESVTQGEEPYGPRKQVATEEWQPLNLGHLSDLPISQISIINKEGFFTQRIPSEKQKAEVSGKILEICSVETIENPAIKDPSSYAWLVQPKASHRGCFADPTSLRIRCKSGTAKYVITVFPG